MTIHVYMLRCADDSFYVGSTSDGLEARIAKHNIGHYRGYTFSRRPVRLVWSQHFDRIVDGIAAERSSRVGVARRKKP